MEPTAEQTFAVFTAYARNEIRERQARRRVVAFLGGDSLADFIGQNVVLAALTRGLADASVTAIYRAVAPERDFVAACNPWIDATMAVEPGGAFTALVDWFDAGTDAPVRCPKPAWSGRGLDSPDVLLVPGTLGVCPAHLDGLAEAPPVFRLPDDAGVPPAPIGRGGGPQPWFAAVHGLDAGTVAAGADLIEDAGGALVPLDGLSFADAAAAVARARFAFGGDPALASLASALRVPSAYLGPVQRPFRVWNREDVAFAEPADGADVVRSMLSATGAATSWRAPADRGGAAPAAEGVVLPPPQRGAPLCRVWPDGVA